MASGNSTPNPYQVSDAQMKANIKTGQAQQQFNMIDQTGPYGSMKYVQSGTYPDGTPKYTLQTSLNGQEQGIYDMNAANRMRIGEMAKMAAGNLKNTLKNPFDLNSASETKYEQLSRSRLDPLWAQRSQSYESDLLNRGIRPGSEGYNTMMNQFNQGKNDSYNSLYTTGKQLFDQEAMAERMQGFNELSMLMGGSQVYNPTFQNTPQTQLANTDVAGNIYKSAQMDQANNNAMMGGLFGLGSAGLGMFKFSDRRLKRDIEHIGENAGLNVYSFRYLWSDEPHVGYMADEVEKLYPDAVKEIAGFKAVNYGAIHERV